MASKIPPAEAITPLLQGQKNRARAWALTSSLIAAIVQANGRYNAGVRDRRRKSTRARRSEKARNELKWV